jgi:DNA polymerase III alpha subunit
MPDAIPFFKTHNSIGKSILTVSDVFRLAGDNRLDSVVLIEDMMIGFPEALRLSKKTGIKLIYGIRFDICNSLEESYEDIVSSRCKMIAIMKNDDGYKDLIKLYTSVHTNDKKCIDYKILRDIWDSSSNIDFGLPFYDSFIAKNCLTLSNCLPDFGIKSPFVCVENNCHPFDDIVQDRVKQYCSINENRIVFCKSIYYENYDDFDSYTVYRLICGRSVYGNSTLDKPNLPHFGSNKFCFEDWKENRKCSFNYHPKEDFSLKDKRIILFDTETEGLNLRTSRPWQIAWVEMKNGKVLNKEMHYLAWDNLNVSKEAAAVTGFDKKVYDVKKENPKEIIDKFWNLIYQPDTILAGQNIIGFDIFILNIARKCIGYLEDYSFLYKCIDTVPLSRAYLLNFHRSENETMIEFCYKLLNFKPKGRISVKLSSMLDKFGIKYKEDKLHDALVDTEMTGELFIRLIRALGLENETCFINKDYSLSLENEYSQKLIENNQIYDTPMLEGVILPKADIPQDEAIQLGLDGNCSSYDFLKALCENGFKRLGIDNLPNFEDYKKRLDYELEVLEACGFIDYMLLNREIVRFCNSSGIPVGDGRGSAAGCLVFYLTGVTGIDPLEHNLIFERFVSMARAQKKIGKDGKVYLDGGLLADCDLDISYSDRSKVVDFVFQRFNGNACKILTVSTLSGKLCIKETMKLAGGYHEEDTKAISDLIPKKYGVVRPLSEAYETSKEFKEFCNSNEKIYLISLKLENLNKNTGVHPSGIAICAFPLSETMPLQTTKEGDLISGFEMGEVAEIMTKFDLLGLRTLTQIKETCDMLGINHKDIDYRNPEIYKYINEYLMPKGLFQIESDTNYRVAQVVAPDNLDELSDVVALARPGALAYVNDYVKAKNTGEMRPSGDEHMDSLLGQTKGILLFQETLMNIAHKIFGFTLERADALRKCVGKKQVEKMPQFEQEILDGAKKNGISEEAALYFWHVCQESANYSFNRCLGLNNTVELESGEKIPLSKVKIGDSIKAFDVKGKKDYFVKVVNIYKSQNVLADFKLSVYESFADGPFSYTEVSETFKIRSSFRHKYLDSENFKMIEIIKILNDALSYGSPTHMILTESGEAELEEFSNIKFEDCIDLEVDSPDHNFYCNGVVVSNSHSISYAATAAKTVYLKYWFPKEFFCTLLEQANAEPDPFAEIEKISQELPYFGIKLLPPDLANSHLHFAIEGDNIRYGLASIKGVSAQTLQKVVNFRNDTQRDICDIYNSAKRAGLSIGVLSSFAQAGLFDSFLNGHERCYMVYTLQVINVLTPRQRDAVFAIYKNKLNESSQDEPDLLLIISDCVKNETRDSNGRVLFRGGFSSLQDKCRKFKAIYEQNNKMPDFADWYYEKRVLGYAYSKNVKDIFADKSSSMTDCQEIKQLAEYTTVKIVGWASDDFQEGKSKKNGEKYWRFSINDDKGKVMCLMMDSRNGRNPSLTLSNYIANGGKRPHDGNIIVVVGSKSKDIVFVTGLSIVEEKIYSRFADLKDAE